MPVLFSGTVVAQDISSAGLRNNFYQAINSEWIKAHPVPDDKVESTSFTEIQDKVDKKFGELMERLKKQDNHSADQQKLVDIYVSFADMQQRNSNGIKPIEAELAAIEGIRNYEDLMKLMAGFSRNGIGEPIKPGINLDKKDSSRYIMELSQGGMGTIKEHYESKEEVSAKRIKLLREQYRKLLSLAQFDQLDQRVNRVIAVERAGQNPMDESPQQR